MQEASLLVHNTQQNPSGFLRVPWPKKILGTTDLSILSFYKKKEIDDKMIFNNTVYKMSQKKIAHCFFNISIMYPL